MSGHVSDSHQRQFGRIARRARSLLPVDSPAAAAALFAAPFRNRSGAAMSRLSALAAIAVSATLAIPFAPLAAAPTDVAREAEPVVMTGADLPTWSRLAADGAPKTYPSGASDGVRDAHNGTITIPPDPREKGVDV